MSTAAAQPQGLTPAGARFHTRGGCGGTGPEAGKWGGRCMGVSQTAAVRARRGAVSAGAALQAREPTAQAALDLDMAARCRCEKRCGERGLLLQLLRRGGRECPLLKLLRHSAAAAAPTDSARAPKEGCLPGGPLCGRRRAGARCGAAVLSGLALRPAGMTHYKGCTCDGGFQPQTLHICTLQRDASHTASAHGPHSISNLHFIQLYSNTLKNYWSKSQVSLVREQCSQWHTAQSSKCASSQKQHKI